MKNLSADIEIAIKDAIYGMNLDIKMIPRMILQIISFGGSLYYRSLI